MAFPAGSVVWREGMMLQPQHFQQSQRHVAALTATTLDTPWAYGVCSVVLDEAAVGEGILRIESARVSLPDNSLVDAPAHGPIPLPRAFLPQFGAQVQTLDVWLGLPMVVEGRAAVSQTEGDGARYRTRVVEMADESGVGAVLPIEIAEPLATIRLGSEGLDGVSAVRVARITRGPDGRPQIDPDYIPPLTRIGGSPRLMELLHSLLQVIMGRQAALAAARRHVAGGGAVLSSAEQAASSMLLLINSYAPILAHYHHAPHVHPWELYGQLNQFCGGLCTFSSDLSISAIPRYNHEDLAGTFGTLAAMIRAVLGVDIASRCMSLPMEQRGTASFACRPGDPRLLGQCRLFLGLSAQVPEKQLVVSALQRIKLASAERLEVLVASAIPGLPLVHVPRPPEELAARPDWVYFAIGQQGDAWEGVRTSGTLAAHFPGEYPGLRLEVLAVRA